MNLSRFLPEPDAIARRINIGHIVSALGYTLANPLNAVLRPYRPSICRPPRFGEELPFRPRSRPFVADLREASPMPANSC